MSEDRDCRATLQVRNPDGDRATLIVTRHGARTWLTFDGGWRSTAVLSTEESALLQGMLDQVQR